VYDLFVLLYDYDYNFYATKFIEQIIIRTTISQSN